MANQTEEVGETAPRKTVEEVDRVAIRFTGDSGDGMQLTGSKFTEATALAGNDLSTFPDFPAEIRAPAGTLAGVSGFQIHFSSRDVRTPADQPDVLVAFNPAALRANIDDVRPGGMVIVNLDAFTPRNVERAGYEGDPLEGLHDRFKVVEIPVTKLNREALKDLELSSREADRCKNFFALGLMYWLYDRPIEPTVDWITGRFPGVVGEANVRALKTGFHFGETTELFPVSYVVPRAKIQPGLYRNITGNQAVAWGIVAAASRFDRPIFLGAYPITPASDVLHELARFRHFGIKTFQAEDEIAAISSSIGASFVGQLGITTTSGPGFVLKQEALGLAVMAELPLVVVDIQRGGPSTGLPTKTEQADLLLALHGRNSDSPIPVIAASTPGDCFYTVLEAFQMAVRYMTPVVMLSDGYLATSSEPWPVPDVDTLLRGEVHYAEGDPDAFLPYDRDPETLARPWAVPGTPGLEHRVGGLEKADRTGHVSYDPANHDTMVRLRAEKIARIARDLPEAEVTGPPRGKLLVVGWGGTHGAITEACENAREAGLPVSNLHLRHMNPFPSNLGELLGNFERILVPELNLGQLSQLLRSEFLAPADSLTKVSGQPFKVGEIRERIDAMLGDSS